MARIYNESETAEVRDKIDTGAMTYEQMKAITPKEVDPNDVIVRPPTRFERKMTRLFGSGVNTTVMFTQGFMMGGLVGCGIGLAAGTFSAIKYRQFSLIPLSMIASGSMFGCLMGIGGVTRSMM